MRYVQVKRLGTLSAFREHLAQLGIELPVATAVEADGVLATPVDVHDGSAGTLRIANRFAVLPMEGWDGTADGRPTELVRRRWQRFAASGCGLVWGEATAVRSDGRANPNQLVIDETTVDDLASLRAVLDPAQVVGLQLTHSGRFSRPDGEPAPRLAYHHPLLDLRATGPVLTDDELDELVEAYINGAELAHQAGFDFVDLKHCHGYLLHELLSATDRPGRYGGDLHGRTAFLRTVTAGIRQRVPSLALAVRLSVFDLVPFAPGPGGSGVPQLEGGYPFAFGGDGSGLGVDLTETHAFLDELERLGIGLLGTTAGSPYYNPHVQRPAYFPASDAYGPPEDPLVGVARQVAATAELKVRHPNLTVVGAGYSYLQDWLAHVAQGVVGGGGADVIGLGRMMLSYPTLTTDVLAGRPLDRAHVCRTFSDCTTGPRHGLVSGCFPLDPFYKDHPQRLELAQIKKRLRTR